MFNWARVRSRHARTSPDSISQEAISRRKSVRCRAAKGATSHMAQVVQQFRSKRYKEAAKGAITDPVAVDQAVDAVKKFKPTKFDQSVELIFSLGPS